MRQMAGTVAVISTEADGEWHGMSATSVMSLSMDPPALLFCINRAASIYQPLLTRGDACINLLTRKQAELCSVFSGKEKGGARFAYGRWRAGRGGVPCLDEALGHVFVHAREEFVYSTHGVFSGAVEEVRLDSAQWPLVYLNGDFVKVG